MDIPAWATSGNQMGFGDTYAGAPPQPSLIQLSGDRRQPPTPLQSFLAAPAPRPPPPPAHAPTSYTRAPPGGAPAWKGGGGNPTDASGLRLSADSNSAMAALMAAKVAAKARNARSKLRQSAELRLRESEARKSAERLDGGDMQQQQQQAPPPPPPPPPQQQQDQQPRPRAVYKPPGRGKGAMAKLTGAMNAKKVARRQNVEHPLYEGTIRGVKVRHESRFVAASRIRAVARIRVRRKARGSRAYSDENQAPPPKTGLDLFMEAKRVEVDPRGRMAPAAVERKLMWQWRRMDDSDPGDDQDRRFWHNKAEDENKVRHAALELEWNRKNPTVPEPAVKSLRPIPEKREVFELERGIHAQRPDAISTHVFEHSLRNSMESVADIREAHKRDALRPRGGTLAFTDKAEVTQPGEVDAYDTQWRETEARRRGEPPAPKGPWRARPRPEWERPWKKLPPGQQQQQQQQQQDEDEDEDEEEKDGKDGPALALKGAVAATRFADAMRESLEKKKDPSLLAGYLASRDAPLTDALRSSLELPSQQQPPPPLQQQQQQSQLSVGGAASKHGGGAVLDRAGAAALAIDHQRWLRTFYATHNPNRLRDHPGLLDELLAKWNGRERELFSRLQVKYDRLAKENRNGKAALRTAANAAGEQGLHGGMERYRYGPRGSKAGASLTVGEVARDEAGDLPRTMGNDPSIEWYEHRGPDSFMDPTHSFQQKVDPAYAGESVLLYEAAQHEEEAAAAAQGGGARNRGSSFGKPFDEKNPKAVRASRDEPGAVFGFGSEEGRYRHPPPPRSRTPTIDYDAAMPNTISSSPPPPPVLSTSPASSQRRSFSPSRSQQQRRSRSRSPPASSSSQQQRLHSVRSDAAVGSSPPRRSRSRERIAGRFAPSNGGASSSQSPSRRSGFSSSAQRSRQQHDHHHHHHHQQQQQRQRRTRATSPFDESVLRSVFPGQRAPDSPRASYYHSRRSQGGDAGVNPAHLQHNGGGNGHFNALPFPAPAGVAGGSDLGTFVNAVSGFMGGAAMMLQECRDTMANGGGSNRRRRRRRRRHEDEFGDEYEEYEDDDEDDDEEGGRGVASEFDAVFAARDNALQQYNGGSGAGAEVLQAWAEQPPPSRNALLQRLSEKLDDLESHEATVAARLRARKALAARQRDLDMEAHALGTNEVTASGIGVGGGVFLPLGALVHAAAAETSAAATAAAAASSSSSSSSSSSTGTAVRALEAASSASAETSGRAFGRAVQPIDVSMHPNKASELAAHAEQFKLYRKHTCETQLLATGMSQAAIIELLAEDIVAELLNQGAKEIETAVDECAQAIFDAT